MIVNCNRGGRRTARHLVFTSHTVRRRHHSRCYTIATDGSPRTQITPFSLGATFPDWSPNGQYIAFGSHADQPNSSVYVYTVHSGEIAQVTIAAADTDDTAPRFGPDSRHIVFTSSAQSGGDDLDLYVLQLLQPPHGAHDLPATNITHTPDAGEFYSGWTASG